MATRGVWGWLRSLVRRSQDSSSGDDSKPAPESRPEAKPAPESRPEANSSASRGQAADGENTGTETGVVTSQDRHEVYLIRTVTLCWQRYIQPALLHLQEDKQLPVNPVYAAVLGLLATFWLLSVGGGLLRLLATLLAPAVRSTQALEAGESEQRRRWLSYWAVYATAGTVSSTGGQLLQLLPGYWAGETLLLLWCAAPYPWHGSDYVVQQLLVPAFERTAAALRSFWDTTAAAVPAERT